MSVFQTYFGLGFDHILDIGAYDHMLFLAVLLAGTKPKAWRAVIGLITAFTVGHSITLATTALGFIILDSSWVEFLIPVTILITAVSNLTGKDTKLRGRLTLTAAFGLIHGMGFAGYLAQLLPKESGIVGPLFSFNVGVEAGQLCFAALMIGLLLVVQLISKNAIHTAQKAISVVGILISIFLTISNSPFS